MQQNKKRTTLTQAAGLLSLGLLLQVAFTYPLWMYEEWRVLPYIALISYLSLDWITFDYINVILLTVSLLVIMFAPQRRFWYLTFLVLIIILFIQDTARFQYSIYIFSVLLGFLYFQKKEKGYQQQLIQALQMGLIGIYFWAGFYQLTPNYTQFIFPELWGFNANIETPLIIAYLPALLALLTAIGLFFPTTRLSAIGIAIVYHGVQLYPYQTPLEGDSPLIWSYHLVTICLVFLLFKNEKQPIFHQSFTYLKTFPIVPYAFIFFGTLPFFQFTFPLHPSVKLQPSHTISTSTTFFFHRQDRFCLPSEVDDHLFTSSTDLVERKILRVYLQDWYATELGVTFLMNNEQQKNLLDELCSCLDYEHQGGFTIVRQDEWTMEESVQEIRCEDVR